MLDRTFLRQVLRIDRPAEALDVPVAQVLFDEVILPGVDSLYALVDLIFETEGMRGEVDDLSNTGLLMAMGMQWIGASLRSKVTVGSSRDILEMP